MPLSTEMPDPVSMAISFAVRIFSMSSGGMLYGVYVMMVPF
jgi:hypothetical protein